NPTRAHGWGRVVQFMVSPTRIYLQTEALQFRRLFWVQNNKPNEMLLGLYGFSGKPAVMAYMWPEYELEGTQLANMKYRFHDAIKVNQEIDHITCHADGRFHLKTKDRRTLYIQAMQRTEPLGPDTPVFLEIILCSDLAENYAPVNGQVKFPHVWFGLAPDNYIALRGMFAGAHYDIERVMIDTMSQFSCQHGGVVLISGTIKGVLMGHPKNGPSTAQPDRPRGSMLSFKFPVGDDKWHIKTFLFQ
ncbi:MAG: hypothetical protein ACREXR_13950, partial [Gammaproteobacteria bacterium]